METVSAGAHTDCMGTEGITSASENQRHRHAYDPVEVSTGLHLDVTSKDPEQIALFDKLHGDCPVQTLICAACDERSDERFLYLRVSYGTRQVCQYHPAEVAAASRKSPEHQALQDAICRLAEHCGLTAEQEATDGTRDRRTDVVVSGGTTRVGWEVQLSPIKGNDLHDRINKAVRDGLASSWLSMRSRPAWNRLVKQGPATAIKDMFASEILQTDNPRILGGIKHIELEPCDRDHRKKPWHQGLRCTGWHGQPKALEPDEHPHLSGVIEQTADGRLRSYQWPRKVGHYGRYWLLVPAPDVERFEDAERPFLERATIAGPGSNGRVTAADRVPTHVSMTRRDSPAPFEDILGPPCPHCGWRLGLGRHRPTITLGGRIEACPLAES